MASIKQVALAGQGVKNNIEIYGKIPEKVQVGDGWVNIAQYAHFGVMAILQIASGNNSNIMPKAVPADKVPGDSYENMKPGKILFKDYVDYADRIYGYLNNNKSLPPYGKCALGDVSWQNSIYLFSKVLDAYMENSKLPNYMALERWSHQPKIKSGIGTDGNCSWNSSYTIFKQELQGSRLTCGPSSFVIAARDFNISLSVREAADKLGTLIYPIGTSPAQLLSNGVKIFKEKGVLVKAYTQNLSEVGLEGVCDVLEDTRKTGILHVNWKVNQGGHYHTPIKACRKEKTITIAETLHAAYETRSFSEELRWAAGISGPSFIVYERID